MKVGIKQYFNPTPKNVQKWLLAIKTLLGTAATASFFSSNENAAFWIMFAGAAINELANLIGEPTE